MKKWVTILLLLLLLPSFIGLLVTYILPDSSEWGQVLSYVFAPVFTAIFAYFLFQTRWKSLWVLLMIIGSVAFNIPLQNWLFHSADEIVCYSSVTDLYLPSNKALYFTFDTLEVDYKRISRVTITKKRTHKRGRHSYRTEEKQYYYSVAPAFADTLTLSEYAEREVKAWVVPVEHKVDLPLICYERCIFDLDDYQQAIDKSFCKLHHPDAPVIRPLYHPFTTRKEWRNIFFHIGGLVLSLFVLIGVLMDYRAEDKTKRTWIQKK